MNQKGFVPEVLLVVAAAAFILGGYEIWHYQTGQNTSAESIVSGAQNQLNAGRPSQAVLNQELLSAQKILGERSDALSRMEADFTSSPALNAQVDRQYASAEAAVVKTDSILNALAKQDPSGTAALLTLRASLDADFANWQKASGPSATTLALSLQALSDLSLMESYINQLDSYVNTLTPTNSNLAANQIINLQNQTSDAAVSVNSAVTGVNSVSEPAVADTGTNSNSNDSSNDNSNTPVVTVADIVQQQNSVDSASNQVTTIQTQIQQAGADDSSDNSNSSDTSSSADSSSNSGDTAGNTGTSDGGSGSSDQGGQTGGSDQSGGDQSSQTSRNPDYNPDNPYGIPPPQAPAPGGPTLIQGTNSF